MYLGSIPGLASTIYEVSCSTVQYCLDGEIGRRKGLKIPRWKHRAGSIPAPGTMLKEQSSKSLLTYLNPKKSILANISGWFYAILLKHPVLFKESRYTAASVLEKSLPNRWSLFDRMNLQNYSIF